MADNAGGETACEIAIYGEWKWWVFSKMWCISKVEQWERIKYKSVGSKLMI